MGSYLDRDRKALSNTMEVLYNPKMMECFDFAPGRLGEWWLFTEMDKVWEKLRITKGI